MKSNAGALAVLAAGAALFLIPRTSAQAMTSYAAQDTSDVPTAAASNPDDNAASNPDDNATSNATNADGWPSADQLAQYTQEQLFQAFAWMIRCCEHIYPADVIDDACYNLFFGDTPFTDMSDHPVLTGECQKVILPASTCQAVGLAPGCGSTAAGAYQIIVPTWQTVRAQGDYLPDFTADSQDEACRRILQGCGALGSLYAFNASQAVLQASRQWASLPGSKAQQNPKLAGFAQDRFTEGLDIAQAAYS